MRPPRAPMDGDCEVGEIPEVLLPEALQKVRDLPAVLHVLGYAFDVIEEKIPGYDDTTASGMCNTFTQEIHVAPAQCPQQKVSTLVHEALEAMNSLLGLKLSHAKICQLEVALTRFLIDNDVDKLRRYARG